MLFVDYSLEAGNETTLTAASARFLGATDKLKRASDHYNGGTAAAAPLPSGLATLPSVVAVP